MIKIFTLGCLFAMAAAQSLFGSTDKPSVSSVKELLLLSDSPRMIEMSKGQLAAMAGGPIQQALQGKAITPNIKKIVEGSGAAMMEKLNAEMTWETFEPIFVDIYQSMMTQEEVDGIVAFYKTPAGKAMIKKMPALMQASGQRLQQHLGPVMQKLQAIQQETVLQLQAEFAQQN
ncbi:MAG: DUF2059 domain-containing protein [Opitutaceae bacterium]|nr:DUF2059 domain-containing protein [Opitutaceae bacterium]